MNVKKYPQRYAANLIKYGRFYRIWMEMGSRCTNPKRNNYHNYGGKGIKRTWETFDSFHKDMYESYHEHVFKYGERDTTIDRLDNSKNYYKENCKWSTRNEQARNTSANVHITYNGETKTIADWAEIKNMKYQTLYSRIFAYGYTIENALTLPIKNHDPNVI